MAGRIENRKLSAVKKAVVVILIVVAVWAAASFLFGDFVFSGMGPSQPVVKTNVPPGPTNNSTASVVIDSSVNIGAAAKGLHVASVFTVPQARTVTV